MTDSTMTIIGIFVAVILMVIFPLVEVAGKNDDIAQTAVQMAVADFVNEVATNGKITEGDYNKLIQKIHATGNTYDVIIEAKILDENPERRTVASKGTGTELDITEGQYYSIYTEEILKELEGNEGQYLLKKDDYIYVTIKNTNITLGTQLKGMFYKFLGKDNYTIGAESSALIINTGVEEKKDLQITARPDNFYWYMSMQKHTSVTRAEAMKSFNVIYIMDYSGSMARSNVEKMHKTLENQVQTLIGYANKNPELQFKVSVVGFGDYAAELVNITVNNTYNISDLQEKLNNIISKWEDSYVNNGGYTMYGGLNILGDIGRITNYDYNFGKYIYTYTYAPGKGYYIGPGTSYHSAGFMGNVVLEKMKDSSSNDNYVIFMTDGQNEDGVSYYYNTPKSSYHQDNLTENDFKTYFQKLKEGTKGIYVIAYNISSNAQLQWCVGGVEKGGIYNATNSNLASIFDQITINMATSIKKEDVTMATGKTILAGIDPSKPITVKITYNDTTIENSIKVKDAPFITEEAGVYYFNSRDLEEYYKDQIIAGNSEAVAITVEIIYYGADIQEEI